jgi:hypothetical protein
MLAQETMALHNINLSLIVWRLERSRSMSTGR